MPPPALEGKAQAATRIMTQKGHARPKAAPGISFLPFPLLRAKGSSPWFYSLDLTARPF
jgi:hypothetical protein